MKYLVISIFAISCNVCNKHDQKLSCIYYSGATNDTLYESYIVDNFNYSNDEYELIINELLTELNDTLSLHQIDVLINNEGFRKINIGDKYNYRESEFNDFHILRMWSDSSQLNKATILKFKKGKIISVKNIMED